MKVNYNLFGLIPTTHELEGFAISIASYADGSTYGCQGWTEAATYWGARFKAWRLARMYAQMEGQDQFIFIYKGTEPKENEAPICCRVIRVKKTVAFFSN